LELVNLLSKKVIYYFVRVCIFKNLLTSSAEVASAVTTASTARTIRWFHTHQRWYSLTCYDCRATKFQLTASRKPERQCDEASSGSSYRHKLQEDLPESDFVVVSDSNLIDSRHHFDYYYYYYYYYYYCNNCQFVDRCINFDVDYLL